MKSGFWNDNPPKDVLTNRRIEHYIREGRYGEDARQTLLANRRKRQGTRTTISSALKLLQKLADKL